jgi:hypothetical protein
MFTATSLAIVAVVLGLRTYVFKQTETLLAGLPEEYRARIRRALIASE